LDLDEESDVVDAEGDAEDFAEYETLFEKNRIKSSILVELNFAKRERILEFFEYLIRVADEQL
jgi:hypothetical protein